MPDLPVDLENMNPLQIVITTLNDNNKETDDKIDALSKKTESLSNKIDYFIRTEGRMIVANTEAIVTLKKYQYLLLSLLLTGGGALTYVVGI